MVESTSTLSNRLSPVACAVCGGSVPSGRRSLCSAKCEQRQAVIRSRRAFEAKQAAGATRTVDDLNSTLYGPDRAGTVVIGGFGVGVHVSDGHLVVSTRDEGELRFSRVDRLRRLVIVGTSGSVSLLALWWCREVDASVLIVEPSGRVLTIAAPESRNDSRLRRAQATAPWTPAGLTLARDLNQLKLQGYQTVLGKLKPGDKISVAIDAVRHAAAALDGAQTLAEVRKVEADCGAAYHTALADVPMRWRDADRLPRHWLTLGSRTSIFGQGARSATTPGQALRNFLGGLASAEIAGRLSDDRPRPRYGNRSSPRRQGTGVPGMGGDGGGAPDPRQVDPRRSREPRRGGEGTSTSSPAERSNSVRTGQHSSQTSRPEPGRSSRR